MNKKKLYIFDFDETLVRTEGRIQIKNKNNENIRRIKHHEYYDYILGENEYYDISEFHQVINPTTNEELINKLKENQNISVILTARSEAEPVKEYLLSIGINVPVNAVGINIPTSNSVFENANRKKLWTKKAIEKKHYNHIEFWDDNEFNIKSVGSLVKEFPNIIIKTHLVRMD